jgi:hypothetical protein
MAFTPRLTKNDLIDVFNAFFAEYSKQHGGKGKRNDACAIFLYLTQTDDRFLTVKKAAREWAVTEDYAFKKEFEFIDLGGSSHYDRILGRLNHSKRPNVTDASIELLCHYYADPTVDTRETARISGQYASRILDLVAVCKEEKSTQTKMALSRARAAKSVSVSIAGVSERTRKNFGISTASASVTIPDLTKFHHENPISAINTYTLLSGKVTIIISESVGSDDDEDTFWVIMRKRLSANRAQTAVTSKAEYLSERGWVGLSGRHVAKRFKSAQLAHAWLAANSKVIAEARVSPMSAAIVTASKKIATSIPELRVQIHNGIRARGIEDNWQYNVMPPKDNDHLVITFLDDDSNDSATLSLQSITDRGIGFKKLLSRNRVVVDNSRVAAKSVIEAASHCVDELLDLIKKAGTV